jgi:hypothetical protein
MAMEGIFDPRLYVIARREKERRSPVRNIRVIVKEFARGSAVNRISRRRLENAARMIARDDLSIIEAFRSGIKSATDALLLHQSSHFHRVDRTSRNNLNSRLLVDH